MNPASGLVNGLGWGWGKGHSSPQLNCHFLLEAFSVPFHHHTLTTLFSELAVMFVCDLLSISSLPTGTKVCEFKDHVFLFIPIGQCSAWGLAHSRCSTHTSE